ncbi:hypothetical protein GM415_17895 [Pseudodesulfovibrio cashew]|uniref:Uncharacterized protein n=1 Tax=Pseudodesulfovibrio cashew TaxID=2678688 RepID=A0A6I6JGC8_9BACT|nr:hypothetical protein [Pseudodesulfovibrio cashew]QGY41916.1 hypothetical protein GM415_17895 [Pseudodesulfovibrio cashew]
MNLVELFSMITQPPLAAWDMVAAGNGPLAGLACSMTVNLAILTVVLLGAVRLVMPRRPGENRHR